MKTKTLTEKAIKVNLIENAREDGIFSVASRIFFNQNYKLNLHFNGEVYSHTRLNRFIEKAILESEEKLVARARELEQEDYEQAKKDLQNASLEYATGFKIVDQITEKSVSKPSRNEDDYDEEGYILPSKPAKRIN